MKERLLPDIVPISASSLEMWRRCPRSTSTSTCSACPRATRVRRRTSATSCTRCSSDPPRRVVLRHRPRRGGARAPRHRGRRCARRHRRPSREAVPVARRAREATSWRWRGSIGVPPPMFMATGKLDALWQHDQLLEVRDYKTGSVVTERIVDDPRARLQAWLAAPIAERLGLQLRVRYEHLAAEILDDPEPFEPEAEDLDGDRRGAARHGGGDPVRGRRARVPRAWPRPRSAASAATGRSARRARPPGSRPGRPRRIPTSTTSDARRRVGRVGRVRPHAPRSPNPGARRSRSDPATRRGPRRGARADRPARDRGARRRRRCRRERLAARRASTPWPSSTCCSWKYPDPGALLARRVGASPRTTITTTVGGNTPQMLRQPARGGDRPR